MSDIRDGEMDKVRLNEEAARRLMKRATELDASLASQSSIAELREAARGAGISDEAFQRALDEVRASEAPPVGQPPMRRQLREGYVILAVSVLMAILVGILVSRGQPVKFEKAAPPAVQPAPPHTMPPDNMPVVPPPTTAGPTQKLPTTKHRP